MDKYGDMYDTRKSTRTLDKAIEACDKALEIMKANIYLPSSTSLTFFLATQRR
jgi:hypothetical protein